MGHFMKICEAVTNKIKLQTVTLTVHAALVPVSLSSSHGIQQWKLLYGEVVTECIMYIFLKNKW